MARVVTQLCGRPPYSEQVLPQLLLATTWCSPQAKSTMRWPSLGKLRTSLTVMAWKDTSLAPRILCLSPALMWWYFGIHCTKPRSVQAGPRHQRIKPSACCWVETTAQKGKKVEPMLAELGFSTALRPYDKWILEPGPCSIIPLN